MGYFAGYDINTNPGTANSFSTAAFQVDVENYDFYSSLAKRLCKLVRLSLAIFPCRSNIDG
jgi:hypothetical protein